MTDQVTIALARRALLGCAAGRGEAVLRRTAAWCACFVVSVCTLAALRRRA